MVMKVVTGLRGTGAEGVVVMTVEVLIVVVMTVEALIVVAMTEVEEEEAHPLVWGKSESLPHNRYHYLLLVLLDGSARFI